MKLPLPDWFFESTWAGKVRELPYTALTPDEEALFDKDFGTILEVLRKHDAEIAADVDAARPWFKVACGIFKGHFDLPFGGMETSSGQFGFVYPLPAYPFLAANYWLKTVTAGWNNLFGSSGSEIAGNSTVGSRRMYAYQGLLSVAGDPKMSAYHFTVNAYTYPPQHTLIYTKIPKKDTWIRSYPFLKKVLIHPTGNHFLKAAFEQAGQVELIPDGMMIAEHDYLKAEGSFYT